MWNENHTRNNVGINEVLNCILTLLLLANVVFSWIQNCGTICKTEILVQSFASTLWLIILPRWDGRALHIWDAGQAVLVPCGLAGPPLPASMHGQSQKKEEDRRGGKRIVLTYLALVKVAGRGCPLDHYWPLNSKLLFHSMVSLQAELKGDVN